MGQTCLSERLPALLGAGITHNMDMLRIFHDKIAPEAWWRGERRQILRIPFGQSKKASVTSLSSILRDMGNKSSDTIKPATKTPDEIPAKPPCKAPDPDKTPAKTDKAPEKAPLPPHKTPDSSAENSPDYHPVPYDLLGVKTLSRDLTQTAPLLSKDVKESIDNFTTHMDKNVVIIEKSVQSSTTTVLIAFFVSVSFVAFAVIIHFFYRNNH